MTKIETIKAELEQVKGFTVEADGTNLDVRCSGIYVRVWNMRLPTGVFAAIVDEDTGTFKPPKWEVNKAQDVVALVDAKLMLAKAAA